MPQAVISDFAVLDLGKMSDDQFFDFCARNSGYRIERTARGEIHVMPGTGGRTGNRNAGLTAQLFVWTEKDGRGAAFDSSTLFRLPNTAMRSPDAAWVSFERLRPLDPGQKERFLPLCPEFVVELTSPSDRLRDVRTKMSEWMANGCELGWIVDVQRRRVHIHRQSGLETLTEPERVAGEGPVAGFVLELNRIWNPGW